MTKRLFLILIILFSTFQVTHWRWYDAGVFINAIQNSWATWCPQDWDTWWLSDAAWGRHYFANLVGSSLAPTWYYDSKMYYGNSYWWWWQIRCLNYDNYQAIPTISYASAEQPSAVNITITPNDTTIDGGLWLVRIIVQQSINWWAFTNFYTRTPAMGVAARTFSSWYSDDDRYQYRAIAYDGATRDINGNDTWIWNSAQQTGGIIIFDKTPPTVSIGYPDIWTNTAQNVTVTSSDAVRVKQITLETRYSTDMWATWTSWSNVTVPAATWDNINSPTPANRVYTQAAVNNRWYQFRARAEDYNNNVSAWQYSTWPASLKFDTEAPTWVTVTPLTRDQLATSSLSITATTDSEVDGIGSPAAGISMRFESQTTPNTFWAVVTQNSPHTIVWNASLVDNDILASWWRQYTLDFTNVCDQAWNCSALIPDVTFTIYPSTSNLGVRQVTTNDLSSSDRAEGTQKLLRIELRDAYGNDIKTASWIGRQMNFNFTVSNSLYLDQYRKQGSAVYATIPGSATYTNTRYTVSTWSTINTFTNLPLSSTWWIYDFWYKVYAPTYNMDALANPEARFNIGGISVDVTWTVWNATIPIYNTLGSSAFTQNFMFSPIYSTAFSGPILDDWLLEWFQQSWVISFTRTGGLDPVGLSNFNGYIEFWAWARQSTPELNLRYSISTGAPGTPNRDVVEWNQAWGVSLLWPGTPPVLLTSNAAPRIYNINALLSQVLPSAPAHSTYLSTHLTYQLPNPNGVGAPVSIVTNSDILWKTNYYEDTWVTSVQTWMKIIWIWSSTNTWEVISWQFDDDIIVLGNISKSELKKNILSKVNSAIKNVWTLSYASWAIEITDLQNLASTSNDGRAMQQDTILYLGNLNNAVVELWDDTLAVGEAVSGKKTLVLVWWDLLIKSNMYYLNPNTDILGIIVMKDKNGNGWNVYIDYRVTNVVWNIFAEKSLYAYDADTWVVVPSSDFSKLKNQLHLYGLVYSENTIGGSRTAPFKCPYYVAAVWCDTQSEAQDYDLNFLRRFYLRPSDGRPASDGAAIWWWTCNVAWVCTALNSSFNKRLENISEPLMQYSVILEYHPLISSNPPPLFGK